MHLSYIFFDIEDEYVVITQIDRLISVSSPNDTFNRK